MCVLGTTLTQTSPQVALLGRLPPHAGRRLVAVAAHARCIMPVLQPLRTAGRVVVARLTGLYDRPHLLKATAARDCCILQSCLNVQGCAATCPWMGCGVQLATPQVARPDRHAVTPCCAPL